MDKQLKRLLKEIEELDAVQTQALLGGIAAQLKESAQHYKTEGMADMESAFMCAALDLDLAYKAMELPARDLS